MMEKKYIAIANREELADELGAAGESTEDWRDANIAEMRKRVVDVLAGWSRDFPTIRDFNDVIQ